MGKEFTGYQDVRIFKIFAEKNMHVISQAKLDVCFRGQVIGEFFADFLVEDRVILEIKAVQSLEKIHMAQVINYLKVSRVDVGLLVNFGQPHIQYNRLRKPEPNEKKPLFMGYITE